MEPPLKLCIIFGVTYNPKQERSFKVVLKHMPHKERIDELNGDIEDLGDKVILVR